MLLASKQKIIATSLATSLALKGYVRLSLALCLALGLGVSLPSCYVTKLALQHNNLYNSRRSISAVLKDPATPKRTHEQLVEVQKILSFAAKEGLHSEGAYRYFIATEQPAVTYLVQAAYPDRLESLSWWFPVVGRVPYLGFYSREERDAEAAKLTAQGYDVHKGSAGAFSSLGWFDDPIYSSMLQRSRLDLALLLFHELTHRTLWVADSAEFSEQLATFCEEQLTLKLLNAQGRQEEIERYFRQKADERLYQKWLQSLKLELEALYAKPLDDSEHFKSQLKLQKAEIFASFSGEKRPKFQEVDAIGSKPWNNATFLAASLYSPDTERFAQSYRCTNATTLGAFLRALGAALEEQPSRPYAALDSLCKHSGR